MKLGLSVCRGWMTLWMVHVLGCEVSINKGQSPAEPRGAGGASAGNQGSGGRSGPEQGGHAQAGQGDSNQGESGQGGHGEGGQCEGGQAGAGGKVDPGNCQPTIVEAGAYPLGSTDGQGAFDTTLTIEVPAGTRSFTLQGSSTSTTSAIFLTRLVDPQGATLYDISQPSNPYRAGASRAGTPMAQLFPNSPELPLVPGVYQATVAASEPTMASLTTILKPSCGGAAHLPVTFWFAGLTSGVNAAKAASDPMFQGALATFKQLYGAAGIEVRGGEVALRDLSELVGEQQAAALASPDSEGIDSILRALAQATSPGLNYVLVDRMTTGSTQPIGFAGGLPGPAPLYGLGATGVLCSVGDYYSSGESSGVPLGLTFAHEGGHYLGLYHTTERTGAGAEDRDPIADTPACTELDGQGEHGTDVCADGGGSDNVMFWAPQPYLSGHGDAIFSRLLSPGQVGVIKGHPALKID